jgi:endonuclease YncB( thermonuclease family)
MGNKHSRREQRAIVPTPADINAVPHEHSPRIFSLLTTNPDTVPDVICAGVPIWVYIYDVYDGDTVKFLMFSGGTSGPVIKLSLRLLGIDTPEIRGSSVDEKTAAVISRDRLAALIDAPIRSRARLVRQHLTQIVIRDWDKFGGRVLGDIMVDGRSVANVLCEEGFGRKYNGEKKAPWTREDLAKPPFLLT